jgi:hypothetical protein
MGETLLTFVLHGVSISLSFGILGLVLKEYKDRILMRSQHNKMYKEYCEKHGIPFESIGDQLRGD